MVMRDGYGVLGSIQHDQLGAIRLPQALGREHVGGLLGCWLVLYELSYSAESLAHALFPGLVAAALLGLPLLVGGAAARMIGEAAHA